ncbi:MAG: S-methyl-5'-thioinosine phosphorylase [Burkholderiales bacterium]
MLAIIGGSGLTQLPNLEVVRREVVRTPYGDPSGALTLGTIRGKPIAFLARHGYGHTIPPHQVNYRANMWALAQQNVRYVVSVASVGGIRADLAPGTLAIPDQIIDYTHGREFTYFNGTDRSVVHVDFTQPYCEPLRQRLLKAAQEASEPILEGGTYGTTQGPRLESAAEINRMARDGADMVGMTGMPEAGLARELGLCYAAIAVVVNYAAGRGESASGIKLSDINTVSRLALARVHKILEYLVTLDGD